MGKVFSRWAALCMGLMAQVACGEVERPEVATVQAEEALRGTMSVAPMAPGEHVVAALGPGHRRRGFVFDGAAGERISVFADGVQSLDTRLRLYAFSRQRGRAVGAALASNDDTARSDWTDNPLSSSIDGLVLPQAGTYVAVVEAADLVSAGQAVVWFEQDLPDYATPPDFRGSGPAQPLSLLTVQADALPISGSIRDYAALACATDRLVVARLGIDPPTLQAILSDPQRLSALAFEAIYRSSAVPLPGPVVGASGTAQTTAILPADALAVLQAATPVPRPEATRIHTAEQLLLASMLGDGAFATPRVRLLRVHWDNADDASADGILAMDPRSGELRVLAYAVLP